EVTASYHEVADVVRGQITSGELPPGAVLPSETELGRRHGVSRATARLALLQLVNEGLITAGQGRKRQVRNRTPLVVYASRSESIERRIAAGVDAWVADTREQQRVPEQTIGVEMAQADADVARWLEVAPGDIVAVRRRVRMIDGQPDNLNDTYYPMDLAQEIPEILNPADVPQGIIALMRDRGYIQVRYVDELRWRPPTPDEATRLEMPAGVAVLVQARTGYTAERPVKTTVTVWPGDSHVMVYELPA
ncbi:MAG TPA: GntR family transcriptional regulator, partial [Streptosporangiaceae bacterium]|nr:GntR family transcriptional regulator [Streptosporangiaceae bacterium]